METLLPRGLGIVFIAIAVLLLRDVRTYVRQYRTLSRVDPTSGIPTAGSTGTAVGQVSVDVAASPNGPGEIDEADDVGLVAWRVRRRRHTQSRRGSGYSWSTEDAGLAVGEIAVASDDRRVVVDTDAIEEGSDDPWEATAIHLGAADECIRLDEESPIDNLPVDINVGPIGTGNRMQLEINYMREGDDILAHGRVDGEKIRVPADGTGVLGTGSPDTVLGDLRAKVAKRGLIAAALVVAGVAMLAGLTDVSIG